MNDRRLTESQIFISNAKPEAGINHGEVESSCIAIMLYTASPFFILPPSVEPIFSFVTPLKEMLKMHGQSASRNVSHCDSNYRRIRFVSTIESIAIETLLKFARQKLDHSIGLLNGHPTPKPCDAFSGCCIFFTPATTAAPNPPNLSRYNPQVVDFV
jgi:hypothetical protein